MIETGIQAVAMVITVFVSMRALYGSWPWEGDKTWYATRELLLEKSEREDVALSPEQIVHAIASRALQMQSQLENAKVSLLSGEAQNDKRPETRSERVDAGIKEIESQFLKIRQQDKLKSA